MSRPHALLVHSGGFTSRQWKRLAAALAPTHEVLAPDLLGYGEAGAWPVGAPFHFRQDLEHLAAKIAPLPPVHIVGHSYGGFLALQLALARPEAVRSLALYEPVAFSVLDEPEDEEARRGLGGVKARYEPDPTGVDEAWLESFVDWWNGPGAWASLAEGTKEGFRAVGWKLSQEVFSLVTDQTGRAGYGTIGVPTLLLGGARSPYTERRVLEKLAAALPDAALRLFDGAGHMGPITHTAEVNAAILAHLAG